MSGEAPAEDAAGAPSISLAGASFDSSAAEPTLSVAQAAASSLSASTHPARPARVAKRKGKGKSKAKPKVPRMKWTNDMVSKLLEIRFKDGGEVRRKIDTADTNVKKALAWQLFATVLSEELHTVITSLQLTTKYRKMKCEYRKRKRDMQATGNNPLEPMDDTYWSILNDGFSQHPGITGDAMFDSNMDDVPEEDDGTESEDLGPAKDEKKPALVQLATAMQTGMEAIAASMASGGAKSDKIDSLIATLNAQHAESLRIQQQQIELLKLLTENLHK